MTFYNKGIYTISDVARLVNLPSQRVRGWISSYKKEPLIKRNIPNIDDSIYLTFYELMEIRFISYLLKNGVKRSKAFAAHKKAEIELKKENPFATKFTTDGCDIYADNNKAGESKKILDILQEQFALPEIIEISLDQKGIDFDENDRPVKWCPYPDELPLISLDPKYAFGKPIVEGENIPTYTLADAVKAESGNIKSVSNWYDVSLDAVEQAVDFERRIAA